MGENSTKRNSIIFCTNCSLPVDQHSRKKALECALAIARSEASYKNLVLHPEFPPSPSNKDEV